MCQCPNHNDVVHHNVVTRLLAQPVHGTGISYSSLSEDHPAGVVSIYDVKLHVLGEGDCFDLAERRPVAPQESRPAISQ